MKEKKEKADFSILTPITLTSHSFPIGYGAKLEITAPITAEDKGVKYKFVKWSDGVKRPVRRLTWNWKRNVNINAEYTPI